MISIDSIRPNFINKEIFYHLKRIGFISKELAERAGMNSYFNNLIFYASQFHDIGKIAIPDNILYKRGSLSIEEFGLIKKHTIIGEKLLENSNDPLIEMARIIAKFHHEKWNGEGYPFQIKGNCIPLPARIVSIADVYDSLRSKRTYKPALSHEEAMYIIIHGDKRTKPEHFDPEILNIFIKYHKNFDDIFQEFREELWIKSSTWFW